MSSMDLGKDIVIAYIHQNFDRGATILDVGACDGKWSELLDPTFFQIDAVEIFEPNVRRHNLESKYRKVIVDDVKNYNYDWYDVVIFGDVIEHMTVEDAKRNLDYAKAHAKEVIVAVPFMWPQGAIYGNKWEEHIQDDLTADVFMNRYPGFRSMINLGNYCYYRKDCD